MTDTLNNGESIASREKTHFAFDNNYLEWKHWNNAASFGTLSKNQVAYFEAELKRTRMHFQPGSAVLEIGFGNGAFLTYAKTKEWEVCGVEENKALVATASDSGFNVKNSDQTSQLPENHFDLVVAFDVLEHIPQTRLIELLTEIKRVLKNGGIFIARFPNGDSPFGLRNQNGDLTHVTTIGTGKIYHLASQSDMQVIYAGSEAYPLIGVEPKHFIHRLIALPIKIVLETITNLIFFPGSRVAFYSLNLTMIYRKR